MDDIKVPASDAQTDLSAAPKSLGHHDEPAPKQKTVETGIVANLKYDLPAGIVVFLVALPLCLGVALASGAPLFSGIIAGIVGGTVVTIFSGSQLSVSGPAAGLTAIVFEAIHELGAFETFLMAVILAGAFQLALGFLRAGTIASYFPSSVIKGMLAAIGIILILKQLPHAVGYDVDYVGDLSFFQADNRNTFTELFAALSHISLGAIVISTVSLSILILWETPMMKPVKLFPPALLVVLVGVGLNAAYSVFVPEWRLETTAEVRHLVTLPVATSIGEFVGQFTLPDFSQLSNFGVYRVAVTLAIVASLESLLSLEAVDKLDPFKRLSSADQELKAQGIGNLLSGLIGGLPVTAVIVRSATNVNSGGRTKTAAFTHGLLLLFAVMLVPSVLNLIPLASLAAVLLFTGYKLAKVSLFKLMYKAGFDQFIPFVITIIAILFTDLLEGIAIGLAVGIFYILRDHYETSFDLYREHDGMREKIRIVLSEHVSFLNKAQVMQTLRQIPDSAIVEIDGTKSRYIDNDTLEIISDFQANAKYRDIDLTLKGIEPVYVSDSHH